MKSCNNKSLIIVLIAVALMLAQPLGYAFFAGAGTDIAWAEDGEDGDGDLPSEVVDALYLKMDDAGDDGSKHFVGEDFDRKYKTLAVTTKGKTIQLNGYFTTNMSDGVMYETADDTNPIGSVAIDWASSDEDVATVSPVGLITAISDGEATITATVAEESQYEGSAPFKSVLLNISGQSAEYVKDVTIIDGDGNSLSAKGDATTVIDDKNRFFQFSALVTWHDPNSGEDRVEDTRTDAVTSTIKWAIGGSDVVATINEDTGRLKTTEYSGNCFVRCSVTGGVGGKTVTDTARVRVDTGEYEYKPSDSLTLKVVYQEFPDKVVQEHTYPLDTLSGRLPSVTHSYTVFGGGAARYGVIRAEGYLFKDVLALEGVKIDDVYQFRFTTADGYDNPITSKLLYGSGSRYYFPNWDIGGSRAEATVVPPILAFRSNMMWNESTADPSVPLDDATRFRLVFGPLWGGESNSSYQIYYIKAITIVLTGAPPAEIEKPAEILKPVNDDRNDDRSKDKDSPKDDKDKGKNSHAVIAGDRGDNRAGSSFGNGTGRNAGPGGGTGGGGDAGASAVSGGSDGASDGVSDGAAPGPDEYAASSAADSRNAANGAGVIPSTQNGRYRVYEMISNSGSLVAPINMDLPYLSAAGPIAGGCVAVGGLSFFIGFRKRLF
jgi:hypothetical protein